MPSQHLGRDPRSDHIANSDPAADSEVAVKDGDVSTAWAIAFVVVLLLGLLSPFL